MAGPLVATEITLATEKTLEVPRFLRNHLTQSKARTMYVNGTKNNLGAK